MAERITRLPKGVNWNSAWPYAKLPDAKTGKGDWILAISISRDTPGLVAFGPADEGTPELTVHDGSLWGKEIKLRPFYRVETMRDAEKFCVEFCSRGYGNLKPYLPHQDGIPWGFNWSSLTMATVRVASQVADHLFNDRYDEAWMVGRAFEDQLRAAQRDAVKDMLRRGDGPDENGPKGNGEGDE